MQQAANKNERRVIDLREYRQSKDKVRKTEATAPDDQEDLLTKISYHLLMAARAIAAQRKH